jgi:hypothetical protein
MDRAVRRGPRRGAECPETNRLMISLLRYHSRRWPPADEGQVVLADFASLSPGRS